MKKKKTILLVEDELPLVKIITTKLEKNGFGVATAKTVKQAFDYLKNSGDVDAIWLDHYLSGKSSGLDFVTKLKKSSDKSNMIPIFVVSNTASKDNIQSYIKLGVNKYYVKAVHKLDEIVDGVKSVC